MLKFKTLCSTLIGGKVYDINGKTIKEEKLISEGAFSFVYVAVDMNTNKTYALKKTICQDKEKLDMTNREIQILKSLPPHKNIVQYYGSTVVTENNHKVVLMLMGYCEKGSLLQMFQKNKNNIREIHIVKIMKDIMAGLNFLHVQEVPIIHRDIKLENILCDDKGVYKICDFGSYTTDRVKKPSEISKNDLFKLKDEIERDTTLMYRPPELVDFYLNYEISTKVDIWMCGCILYLLLFKTHPFQDNSYLSILNCSYKIPIENKYSKKMTSLLMLMLSKDPEKRLDSTTLLYIFENYVDLKKWIVHVPVETKSTVNLIFDRMNESYLNNEKNKFIEIHDSKILDYKIGNEEYVSNAVTKNQVFTGLTKINSEPVSYKSMDRVDGETNRNENERTTFSKMQSEIISTGKEDYSGLKNSNEIFKDVVKTSAEEGVVHRETQISKEIMNDQKNNVVDSPVKNSIHKNDNENNNNRKHSHIHLEGNNHSDKNTDEKGQKKSVDGNENSASFQLEGKKELIEIESMMASTSDDKPNRNQTCDILDIDSEPMINESVNEKEKKSYKVNKNSLNLVDLCDDAYCKENLEIKKENRLGVQKESDKTSSDIRFDSFFDPWNNEKGTKVDAKGRFDFLENGMYDHNKNNCVGDYKGTNMFNNSPNMKNNNQKLGTSLDNTDIPNVHFTNPLMVHIQSENETINGFINPKKEDYFWAQNFAKYNQNDNSSNNNNSLNDSSFSFEQDNFTSSVSIDNGNNWNMFGFDYSMNQEPNNSFGENKTEGSNSNYIDKTLNENDQEDNFTFNPIFMEGEKLKKGHLIMSDKNDKFSELLEEFQKISSR